MHDFSSTCLYTIGNKVVQVTIVTLHIVFHFVIVALPPTIILIDFAYQFLTKSLTNYVLKEHEENYSFESRTVEMRQFNSITNADLTQLLSSSLTTQFPIPS